MDEVVGRLHRLLIDKLHGRGHSPDLPLKISQIYDEIVPYHAVRSTIQVELAADYDHALLRLLAGEGELLRVEPEEVREAFVQEVNQPFPIVDLFRKYPQCQVWATIPEDGGAPGLEYESAQSPGSMIGLDDWPLPSDLDPGVDPDAAGSPHVHPPLEDLPLEQAGEAPPSDRDPDEDPGPDLDSDLDQALAEVLAEGLAEEPTPESPIADAEPAPPPSPRKPDRSDSMEEDSAAVVAAGTCPFCQGALPGDREARFCPHCGADQRKRPCPTCDAVLERDWQYCINCGREQRE